MTGIISNAKVPLEMLIVAQLLKKLLFMEPNTVMA
jgi:hypothetical protein